MPQLEDENRESLDPVVLAALVEDPDEDEEDKKLREEMLGDTQTVIKGKETEDEDDDDEEDNKKSTTSNDEDDEEDEDDNAGKPTRKKTPVEAEDDTDEDIDDEEEIDEDDKKLSRKEKRQKRQESFLEDIKKDNARRAKPTQVPDYKPVDYSKAPETGFKPDELAQDRERFGAQQFVQGANTVKFWAEQDRFWSDLSSEAKILSYDPKLNFLSETTPDGKKNQNFDPDKAAEINEMYLQLVGFKQMQQTDNQGRPLFDRETGQPIIVSTVDRTDISYEKFAKRYAKNMEKWGEDFAEDRVEQTRDKVIKQRKKQGVRPTGGGSRKSLGSIQLGDITRMSDEELEKNEAEIDRQILEML